MKKIIIFSLFLAFVFSANLSMAQSYPASCPSEAQAIVKAVGGCSAIDRVAYSDIYDKCCVEAVSNSNSNLNLNLIVYALLAVAAIGLATWQVLKRRKLIN
ncbi:MAG: hypothetical protein AAB626_01585 [Patescibacteria group bacterium]